MNNVFAGEQIYSRIRNSNLELYRIVVMLLIVAHHYVVNSGVLDLMYEHPFSGNAIFLFLYGMWGKIGINSFVLITRYFICNNSDYLQKARKYGHFTGYKN